jgi:hypothetical protein
MLTPSGRAASMKATVVAAVLGSLWVLAGTGCATRTIATPAGPFRKPRVAALEEVVAAYDGFCRGVSTLSASGELDVRDLRAAKARRVGVRILAGRGGRLYVKGTVAVVTALEVVADGQRFWFRLPSKRTVWTGPAAGTVGEAASAEDAPYYALRPADLVSAFLPEPLDPEEREALIFEGAGESFSLTLARLQEARGVARRQVGLDASSLRPAWSRAYDEGGSLVREVRYAAWRDGMAHHITVLRPHEGYEAEFALEKVETNVALPERAFVERPAEGYRVVEVGKDG